MKIFNHFVRNTISLLILFSTYPSFGSPNKNSREQYPHANMVVSVTVLTRCNINSKVKIEKEELIAYIASQCSDKNDIYLTLDQKDSLTHSFNTLNENLEYKTIHQENEINTERVFVKNISKLKENDLALTVNF